MTAQLITLPYRPVINLQGGIEPGALLDVFRSGTTTRVQLYADAGFAANLTNPVVANSAGAFPAVYFDDAVAVRVRLRPADGGDPLEDIDPYTTDAASVEAAKDAAELAAAQALASANNAEDQVDLAEAQVDLAEAAAVVAQAFTGPIYANTTLGLANTTNGQGFTVSNANPKLGDVYLNSAGSAVFLRTIILDPTDNSAAGFIGTTSGSSVQAVLDSMGGGSLVDLATDVTGVLPVANGGTGGSTASAARTALGAAASGANTDITALDQDVTVTATGTIAANSIGYRGVPAASQSPGSTITLTLANAAQCVDNTLGGWAIPANATTAFPVRTVIMLYNDSASSQTVTITSDTLRLAGTATTGTRTVLQRGICLLTKVKATEWIASGNVT